MRTIWILGDQLSLTNSALAAADPQEAVVLMVESKARGKVLRYHQQKLVLIYAAMRHFAQELEAAGWHVDYTRLEEGLSFESAAAAPSGKARAGADPARRAKLLF